MRKKTRALAGLTAGVLAASMFMGANAKSLPSDLSLKPLQPSQGNRHKSLPAVAASERPQYVEGELLVRYKHGVTPYQQEQSLSLHGAHEAAAAGPLGYRRVSLEPGRSVEFAMQSFAADPMVQHAQPNYIYRAAAMSNDPQVSQLWGIENSGQTVQSGTYAKNNPGVAGNDINASGAWELTSDCSSVVVAVLDTGINYTHTDLANNMWNGGLTWPNHGYDFVDNDNDPMPVSGTENHGTHVAGTIGAIGNNSAGVTGVCQKANLMSVRVLGPNGGTTATVTQGIDFAVQRGASVINMSLGGASAFDQAFSDAIEAARVADVLVVVAAGNNGAVLDSDNPDYPCSFEHDNVVCVAALDQAYELASFSNRGETVVDVGAPGTNILSNWGGRTIEEPLNVADWNLGINWAINTCTYATSSGSTVSFETLSNPSNWCTSDSLYANNADERAWRHRTLPANMAATLQFVADVDVESPNDYFRVAAGGSNGDPFLSGTILETRTGTHSFQWYMLELRGAGCTGGDCSIGFQLQSNASTTRYGVGLFLASINLQEDGSNAYKVINGTSMATPHVAGVAALVRAFNPDFTYQNVRGALIGGGRPVSLLDRQTTTGRAVDARKALGWLDPPGAPQITVVN